MTETLFQTIEEKVMCLLAELDVLRREVARVKQENAALKADQGNNTKKLQSLASLLADLEVTSNQMCIPSLEPVTARDREDAAVY